MGLKKVKFLESEERSVAVFGANVGAPLVGARKRNNFSNLNARTVIFN